MRMTLATTESLHVLQWTDMIHQGIQPTPYTYSAKVKVESSVGDFNAALRTVQEMQAHGIKPDKSTWHVILSMAQQMSRADIIEQVNCIISHRNVLSFVAADACSLICTFCCRQ